MTGQDRKEINLCIELLNIENYNTYILQQLENKEIDKIDLAGMAAAAANIRRIIANIRKYDLDNGEIIQNLNENKEMFTTEQYQQLINFLKGENEE